MGYRVSIVTPVYNAAENLTMLYDNLCAQSYADWCWIVVDDGSTDGSGDILDDIQAKDGRVTVLHQSNSGSAKMPRDRAVHESTTDFIIPIDADDSVEAGYIETIMRRQEKTGADIVYPRMVYVRNGERGNTLPANDIDTTAIYQGRDVVLFTLPEFRIGCNGGLYKKKVWVNSSYPSYDGSVFMNSDEVDERLYLLEADKVAFCNAEYLYNIGAGSITNSIKLNRFDVLDTDLQLLDIIEKEYGRGSEAYSMAQRHAFLGFRNCMRLYMEHYDDFAEHREFILDKLRCTFRRLASIKLSTKERIQFFGMKSFKLVALLTAIKYRGVF